MNGPNPSPTAVTPCHRLARRPQDRAPSTAGLHGWSGILALILVSLLQPLVAAELPVVGWRGDGSGVVPDANPPTTWSDTENLRWRTPLPNWGNGQPVVAGDLAVVLCEPLMTAPILVCVDAATGELRWQREIEHLEEPLLGEFTAFVEQLRQANSLQGRYFAARVADDAPAMAALAAEAEAAGFVFDAKSPKSDAHVTVYPQDKRQIGRTINDFLRQGAAIPSWHFGGDQNHPGYSCWEGRTFAAPLSDGNRIWAWVSPGVAVCYDRDGEQRWLRFLNAFADDGKPEGKFPDCTFTSAPVIVDGTMVCAGGNRLYGLDADNGRLLWQAVSRSRQAWEPQPFAVIRLGEAVGVLAFDGLIYAPRDGRVLCENLPDPSDGSAVVQKDRVFLQTGKRGSGAMAWRLSVEPTGLWRAHAVWTSSHSICTDHDNRTPLVYDDLLYGTTKLLKADTGELLTEGDSKARTPEGFARLFHSHSSAWLAGDLLLLHGPESKTARSGDVPPAITRVCDPRTLEVLAINRLSDAPAEGAKLHQLLRHSSRGPLGWGPKGLSTIFVQGDRIYIRSHDYLFCIGRP